MNNQTEDIPDASKFIHKTSWTIYCDILHSHIMEDMWLRGNGWTRHIQSEEWGQQFPRYKFCLKETVIGRKTVPVYHSVMAMFTPNTVVVGTVNREKMRRKPRVTIDYEKAMPELRLLTEELKNPRKGFITLRKELTIFQEYYNEQDTSTERVSTD